MNTKNCASFFLEFFFYRYMISYKKKIALFNKQLKIQGHVCCELFNLTCVNIPDTHVHKCTCKCKMSKIWIYIPFFAFDIIHKQVQILLFSFQSFINLGKKNTIRSILNPKKICIINTWQDTSKLLRRCRKWIE